MTSLPEDNRLVMTRLAHEPEFALRLSELIRAYGVVDRPVLAVQARPARGQDVKIDVRAKTVLDEFRIARSQAAWWDGFGARVTPRPVFHGVAGLPSHDRPGWAIEAHRDGHFIGAVWNFPDLPSSEGQVPALAEFYVQMFSDFFSFTAAIALTSGGRCSYVATATFFNANLLSFAAKGWGNSYTVSAPALKLDILQWPIFDAKLGEPQWELLAPQFGEYLLGAYGVSSQS